MEDIIYQDDRADPPVRIMRLSEDDTKVEVLLAGCWWAADDVDTLAAYKAAFLNAYDQAEQIAYDKHMGRS